MLEQLKELFDKCDSCYEVISDNEIAVPCPLNLLHHSKNDLAPQRELIDNRGEDEKIRNVDWEAKIHIEEVNGELNWLIVSSIMNDEGEY
jgi:hypothetical protein